MTDSGAEGQDEQKNGNGSPSPANRAAPGSVIPGEYPLHFIIAAALIFSLATIFVLFLLYPESVWDHFLYRYLWGPVEADAGVGPTVPGEEPEASYNPISTVVYGLMLAGGVYLIYNILERYGIEVDYWFILAVTPYIILGSVARVLEDAMLFEAPYVFFLISPIIYIVLGLVATAICLYSYLVPGRMQEIALHGIRAHLSFLRQAAGKEEGGRRETEEGATRGTVGFMKRELLPGMSRNELNLLAKWIAAEIFPYILFTAIYMVLFYFAKNDFAFLYPPHVIGATAIVFCASHIRLAAHPPRGLKGENRFFLYGLFLLVSFLSFYIRLLTGNAWEEIESSVETHMDVIPIIIGLAILATALTWGLYRNVLPILMEGPGGSDGDGSSSDGSDGGGSSSDGSDGGGISSGGSDKTSIPAAFTTPMAVLLFAVHYLDAAATYIGLEFHDYREKHVLPDFLIQLSGTAAVMFVLKFAVLSFIIYTMEIYYRKEMLANPRMTGLMRIAILVLGLAPGTRDMLRNAAGI